MKRAKTNNDILLPNSHDVLKLLGQKVYTPHFISHHTIIQFEKDT